MNRRDFLGFVGKVGGTAALYPAMAALDLVHAAPPAKFDLSPHEGGRGRKVLILGAGLAGMCIAYELGKRGYDCRILEARDRSGGRCWTVRRGTRLTDTDGEAQVCEFDAGHYFNCGPARIPWHHVTMDYCRELHVAVEPMVNQNESAYYYSTKGPLAGKRVRARAANADGDGYVAELLAKAVHRSALDQEVTKDDREKLIGYLRGFGGIDKDGAYKGTPRRGYKLLPGAALEPGEESEPHSLHELLEAGYGYRFFYNDYEQQAQMFQITGGTDHLAQAFARKLEGRIEHGATVQEIRQDESGVRVRYRQYGASFETKAPYVVCAIPLSVARDIPGDFAPAVRAAMREADYFHTGKVAMQFKRRFWEEDDRIFGGISWTDQDITQIWYPSTGFLGKKGVVVGSYTWEAQAEALGRMTHADRVRVTMEQGGKIHPQYTAEYENAFSIYWPKVPYSLGGWAEWREEQRKGAYALLNQPDGRIYFAGEHLSYMTGWMAGALESARLVSRALHTRFAVEPARKEA